MRLYSAKIPIIAREIIDQLAGDGDIEVGNHDEAELDIQAVLKEYLRLDREVTERAKDILEARHLSHGQFGKVKRTVAEEKGLGMGEEALSWICTQVIEAFMHSNFVDEVYASDADLRRKMKVVLRRNMAVDEELDVEVRKRIRNLEEGTANWDIEYKKVMEQIKRKRGLDD